MAERSNEKTEFVRDRIGKPELQRLRSLLTHSGRDHLTVWEVVEIAGDELAHALTRLAAVERERDAAELMVRRLAEQAVSDEARIAAVEAVADEVHGHGADDERAEVERLRGIISRIAVLAASPTPTGPEPAKYGHCPHGWTRAHCGSCHDEVYGAATPEPTEETPKHADPNLHVAERRRRELAEFEAARGPFCGHTVEEGCTGHGDF